MKTMTYIGITIVLLLIWISYSTSEGIQIQKETLEKIKNQTSTVHWLLPNHGQCAVKQMFFRDEDNKLKPYDRMVCHWELK